MAITNYTELQTTIGYWLNRGDLTARIPEFISLCEAKINRRIPFRTFEADNSLTGTIGSRTIALPAGFISPIALFIERDSGREELPKVSADMETSSANGEPTKWAIDGANVTFDCPCDAAYDFTLRALVSDNLSVSNTTNDMLTNNPDVYLYGSLLEARLYLNANDDRLVRWGTLYERAMDEAEIVASRNRKSPLRTDIPTSRNRFNINTG